MTARPVVPPDELESIDLADPRLHAERELGELWRYLGEARPFYYQQPRGPRPGFWVITRYADAMSVYKDKEHFTTERGNALASLLTGGDSASRIMMAVTDGAQHTQFRNLLMKAFSPRRLAVTRESVRRTVDQLIAVAAEKDECDFVRDVSATSWTCPTRTAATCSA